MARLTQASTIQADDSGPIHTGSDTTCHVNVPVWTPEGLSGRGSVGGRTLLASDVKASIVGLFWKKVQKTDTCWLYTGYRDRNGYGLAYAGKRAGDPSPTFYAHRLSYVLTHGSIPTGMVVMHSCDVPNCVNPDHLRLATQTENIADRVRKGRNKTESPRTRKISTHDVKTIRASSEGSMTLALRFGVCQSHINHIRRGSRRKVA